MLTYNYNSTEVLLSDARRYAEKAAELDPQLPEVHASLGAVRQNLWDWPGAENAYREAIHAYSKFSRAYHWYAGLLHQFARFTEAFEIGTRGLTLDPFDYPSHSAFGLYLGTRDGCRRPRRISSCF